MTNRTMIMNGLKRMDWWLACSLVALMVAGVFFIYSACYRSEDLPVNGLYKKQIMWIIAGLIVFMAVLLIDYRFLLHNNMWLYIIAVVLLILVLLVGKKVYGARRWLWFFGFQLQPSELAKITTILSLASYLGQSERDVRSPTTTFTAFLIMGIPFLLILKEPDLGTAMVLAPTVLGMLFVAGVPVRYLIFIMLAGTLMLPLGWIALNPYQKERLLVFFDPGRDPLGVGWNKMQSLIAVGAGGFSGKGFLQGTQNILGFLPRTVAPTDFIFSVIAEEMGFVGIMTIIGLFLLVLLLCFRAAVVAKDRCGRLLVTGITIMMFCHIYVNIAMTIGLMPITGLPLPLISYGGSFMVSTMLAFGLIQSVYVRREIQR
ncbi:MAG: rod shape-determining protein RodA [Spartobacteria bacterium]|nr:rod shape-determining protein RodA [Spartobacteria bacterium]